MKPEIDIYKSIKTNRIITISVIIFALIATISSLIFSYKVYLFQMNHTLVLDKNADVLPFKYIDYIDARKIEASHHVEMFLKYFYEYDKSSFQERIQKALWLSGPSANDLYLHIQNEGWYKKVVQLNLSQKILVDPKDILIEGDNFPFRFKASCIVIITQLGVSRKYSFETTGLIEDAHRSKTKNPHGLLIVNYEELNKKEIQDGRN